MPQATRHTSKNQTGQSLVELVIGIALGILFISGAVGVIVLTLRISSQNKFSQTASELLYELTNQIPTVASANWHDIADLQRGSSTSYYLIESGNFLAVASGSEALTINGFPYARYFSVFDTYRDDDGEIVAEPAGTLDPSTLLISHVASWIQNGEVAQVSSYQYITRNKSRVFNQSDWSAGAGDTEPHTSPSAGFATETNINYASIAGSIYIHNFETSEASTTNNIDPENKWAWNDVIGWIDFNITDTVTISSSSITGYASSGVGYIALDCATSPTPDCSPSYGVSNDGNGTLSGYAWNDAIGWISFKSTGTSSPYGVTVSTSTGDFSGFAWNDVVGWFSFNCADLSICGTSNFKVQTLWDSTISDGTLISSIFDTQVTDGGAFNTILWQGTLPTGTAVKFQVAGSNNAGGPWNYLGPDGTSNTYYQPAGPDIHTKLDKEVHSDTRYMRYKVILESNIEKTYSPLVNNIVLGWSP